MWRLLLIPALVLAGCGDETTPPSTGTEAATPRASYSYDLESSCGERNLIGTFHVWVEDDEVIRAEATGRTTVEPDLEYVPSLDDLEVMVEEAEPDAVVETERDADGRLTWVSIDHLPDAIDDEECYRISNVRDDGADMRDEPVVSCGGGPGWPVSAMDGGIEPSTPRAEIEAALEQTEQEMGIDGPFQGEREWIVLAEDADEVTLGTGHWDADGPGEGAMVVGYERTDTGLVWTGHGGCARLEPVLAPGEEWVELTAPPGGLDRSATELTVLVTERECTGARDPRPHLNDPTVTEEDDRVVVSWTSRPPEGGGDCQGNPATEVTLTLDEPLGDRELLDGSAWPPTPVE